MFSGNISLYSYYKLFVYTMVLVGSQIRLVIYRSTAVTVVRLLGKSRVYIIVLVLV